MYSHKGKRTTCTTTCYHATSWLWDGMHFCGYQQQIWLLWRPSFFGWLQVGPFLLPTAALLNVTCCTEMEGEGLEDYIMW